MLAEAAGFDGHLRALEREVEAVKAATESLLRTSRSVLASPLPRVFTRPPPGGPPAPVDAGAIGGDFDGDALAAASADAAHRLADNVLAPMERWRAGYATVDKQMARLEAMRLELDSRRHTTAGLAADLDKKRPALERAAGGKGAAKLDEVRRRGGRRGGGWTGRARALTARPLHTRTHAPSLPPPHQLSKRLRHKEGKETASLNRFLAEEELVSQHLGQLIGDAEWLKSFVADVLRCQADAYGAALHALGHTKPTPDVRTPRYEAVVAGGGGQ